MSADPGAESIVAFLRAEGAGQLRHSGSATLLDHLLGTSAILRRWKQPAALQRAALLHSVYGTHAYREELLSVSRRREVAELAGEEAEQLAFRFGATRLDALIAESRSPERDQLLLLHMANLAEQARAEDGSPGRWLLRVAELAEHLIDSETVTLPLFIAELATLSEADESLARRVYLDGLRASLDPEGRASRLALAAATCPVLAEPCIWMAYLNHRREDPASARLWAGRAIQRQLKLGAAWDKRLSFEEWGELAEVLERDEPPATGSADTNAHPRALLEAVLRTDRRPSPSSGASVARPSARSNPPAGTARFHRYVEALARAGGSPLGAVYPELPGRPWYDPRDFPLVGYLESHFDEIRREILSLEAARFQPESEPIGRSGTWDVAFFYERGRRHDEVCLACPVTTRGVEAYPTVRTLAGLIYASRMRGSTHISAHRGPTNLRVRCHLPLIVPAGECAIRVGSETRRWQEGQCLVFDDFFEHEAWNHTDEDRLVLVVDLWHPGLSAAEIDLLGGLQRYADAHAHRLSRYWSTNAAARQAGGSG